MINAAAIGDAAFEVARPRYSVRHWLERDLPPLDPLLGSVLTTTGRGLLIGPTGVGKSNLASALAWTMATGAPFLHWARQRPAKRVAYIDGEMSARVLKARIADAARRHGSVPDNLEFINRDDFPNMAPINTPEGQAFIDGLIEHMGGVEFIVFDNIQSLLGGLMIDEEAWSDTMPWVRSLTRRHIGQLWMHHTGHDTSKGFGTKTREWQMDVVMLMTDRADKGELLIDFDLSFTKARERNRDNRADFTDARIWINADDRWESSTVPAARGNGKKPKTLTPETLKALEYLRDVMVEHAEVPDRPGMPKGVKAVNVERWREGLKKRGLHEGGENGKKWFQRVRNDLTAAERIASDAPYVWIVGK